MKAIFHADDLGATPGVSRKILDAWSSGLIAGFSIIANGTGMDLIPAILNEHPDLEARISVHLNISDGKSVLPSREVPGLVDHHGYFKYGFLGILLKLVLSIPSARKELLEEIRSEWREQIRQCRRISAGRKIQAIDGHIHVHMVPFLFPIAVKLAVEEEIPEIRIPREFWSFPGRIKAILSLQSIVNIMKWALLRLLSVPALRLKKRTGLGGPEAFIGVINTGNNTKSTVLAAWRRLKGIEADTCEILMHIGGASEKEVLEWNPLKPTFQFLTSEGRRREYEELVQLQESRISGNRVSKSLTE